MNENHLLDAISGIDPELLQRSEQKTSSGVWKKVLPLAACLCLIAGPAFLLSRNKVPEAAEPTQFSPLLTDATIEPGIDWEVSYNTTAQSFHSADRALPLGFFTEKLSDGELQAILPQKQLDWMGITGRAGFTGEGTLVNVVLEITTQDPEAPVTLILGDDLDCCVIHTDSVLSKCGELEYAVYQYTSDNQMYKLDAYVKIGDMPARFSMYAPEEKLGAAKADFEAVLECFAWYEEGQPDLSKVKADEIPDWFYKDYTWQEAENDPKYGMLWLKARPTGFAEESIRRHKDQHNDYLNGFWSEGMNYFSWRVWDYREEDAQRLTSVADKKNYDLNLYPIPRAESVPEELFQVVNDPIFDIEELTLEAVLCRAYYVDDVGDSNGCRMQFSVKYGDKVVSITAKGVEPRWLYDQLKALQ